MAPFNPDQSTIEPKSYMDWSRAVGPSIADTSKATQIKSYGEAVGDVIKISDKFVKNMAVAEAGENADALRDIHHATLEAATQPQAIVPQPANNPSGQSVPLPRKDPRKSLLDANASADTGDVDAPDAIGSGLDRVATISAAKQGGKVNDTLYTQQLYSLAKNLRTQYPNYREYIDQTISQLTGIPIANAYAANMLQDLNTARTSQQAELNKSLVKIQSYAGYKTTDGKTMSDVYDYVKATGDTSFANRWIDTVAATEVTARLKTLAVTSGDQDKKSMGEKAEGAFSSISSDMVNNHFYSNTNMFGLTAQKIAEQITEEGLRPGTYSAQVMEDRGRQMKAQEDYMKQKLLWEASRPIVDPSTGKFAVDKDGNKYSYRSLMGDTKTDQMITAALQPYTVASKAALDQHTGTATYAATHAQRVKDDIDNKITSNPDNVAMQVLSWGFKNMGPVLTNTVITEGLKNDVDTKFRNIINDKRMASLMGGEAQTPDGAPPSFKKDTNDFKNGTVTGGKPVAPSSRVYDELVGGIKDLINPEMPDAIKLNKVKYFFSPEGKGALASYDQGYYDKNKRWVPGREVVWDSLTNPTVTAEIARLSKLPGGQGVAKMYKDWMENEFAQYMLQPELKMLSGFDLQVSSGQGSKGNLPVLDKVGLAFHDGQGPDKKFGFEMIDKQGRPIDADYIQGRGAKLPRGAVEAAMLRDYQRGFQRLNDNMVNLVEMQKQLGGDTKTYLWDTLTQTFGVNFEDEVKGMPEKMVEAIKNSKKPPAKLEDVTGKK